MPRADARQTGAAGRCPRKVSHNLSEHAEHGRKSEVTRPSTAEKRSRGEVSKGSDTPYTPGGKVCMLPYGHSAESIKSLRLDETGHQRMSGDHGRTRGRRFGVATARAGLPARAGRRIERPLRGAVGDRQRRHAARASASCAHSPRRRRRRFPSAAQTSRSSSRRRQRVPTSRTTARPARRFRS